MASTRRDTLVRVLALAGVAALIVLLFVYREQLQSLQRYGYLGIFLISIAANATIIIPCPGLPSRPRWGAIFHPLGVAVAAGLGLRWGTLRLPGRVQRAGDCRKTAFYEKLTAWMRAHPRLNMLAIFVLAFIPNPLFDVAGPAAGTLKIPLWQFLLPARRAKSSRWLCLPMPARFRLGG